MTKEIVCMGGGIGWRVCRVPNFSCFAGRGGGSLGLQDITPMNYN